MSDDQSNPRVPGSDSSDVAKTHRLSRRSAIKKAAGITGGILATGAVAGGLPVIARQDSPQPYSVATQTVLTDEDALKQRLMASAAMQPLLQRYGTSALTANHAVHVTYHGMDMQLVSMVLEREGLPGRAVWAYFKPQEMNFHVVQFEFAPSNEMQQALKANKKAGISGRATFFTPSDLTISSALFRNDRLVATGTPAAGLEVDAGEDWGCFENCLLNLWETLPGWLQAICGGACGACFIHVLPACPGCFACVSGYAGTCFFGCWRK